MTTLISLTTENAAYDVKMSAKNIGKSNAFGSGMTYKHRVNVSVNGNKASFVFHTSINDYNNGKIEMDEQDIQSALNCFLCDATAGDMPFYAFCSEFGYKMHKACIAANVKAKRLFHDIYEVLDAVNELENV